MASVKKLVHFIRHYLQSKTRHGTHSPFVYALVEDCLYREVSIPKGVIEHFERLNRSQELVRGYDYGRSLEIEYSVAHLALKSASQTFEAAALAGICQYHQFGRVLELGSNLGKAISYMAAVNADTQFVGVDGNKGAVAHTKKTLAQLNLNNVQIHHSTFNDFFQQNAEQFEMIFIDGDHSYEPTLRNYQEAKSILKGEGPIVLHDIYWSDGMRRAWEKIKADNDATVTIDLFFFGLVYFRKEQRKQHFSIRYPKNLVRKLFF